MTNHEQRSDVVAALEEAEAHCRAFEAEASALVDQISAAARGGDAVQVIRLRQRFDELPAHTSAERLRVAQLRVRVAECSLTEATVLHATESAKAAKTQQRLAEAQAAALEAHIRTHSAEWRRRDAIRDLGERQRKLEALIAEHTGRGLTAPIVRSLPHALAG